MKNAFAALLLTCITLAGWAQQKDFAVLGKVVDSATRQPLLGASAFCQNTTHGTTTNQEGLFFLRLPNGGYDLVVSYMGYTKQVLRISSSQSLADTLVVELVKEEKAMEEVAVVASNEVADGLAKYGSFFTDQFIGTTPNAAQCVLQNPEALRFFYTKKRNRLKVTAREDLLITNYALGYTIRYQLDSFSYDYNTNVSQYTGAPLFQEIDSTDAMQESWKRTVRGLIWDRVFTFMRSLYDSTVIEDGFIVEKLEDDPQSVKGTIIHQLYNGEQYAADSSDVTINWAGRYRISYKSVLPDKRFLQEYKLPAGMKMQVTLLSLTDGFVIEENGYFYEQYDVVNTGYWAWKKLAELLPYNYEYE